MNLFITSDSPEASAKNLDDKRVVKMCLESVQILSSAAHLLWNKKHGLNLDLSYMYKPTHMTHPIVKWTGENYTNFSWVMRYAYALTDEYMTRYQSDTSHASRLILYDMSDKLPRVEEDLSYCVVIPFLNAAKNKSLGVDYSSVPNVFTAYKLYLRHRWATDKREPTWSTPRRVLYKPSFADASWQPTEEDLKPTPLITAKEFMLMHELLHAYPELADLRMQGRTVFNIFTTAAAQIKPDLYTVMWDLGCRTLLRAAVADPRHTFNARLAAGNVLECAVRDCHLDFYNEHVAVRRHADALETLHQRPVARLAPVRTATGTGNDARLGYIINEYFSISPAGG